MIVILVDVLLFLILRIVASVGVDTSLQILNAAVEAAPETSVLSNMTKNRCLPDGICGTLRLRQMKIRVLQHVLLGV